MMIVAWTVIPESPEGDGYYEIPRFDDYDRAAVEGRCAADRTGQAQLVCKVVEVLRYAPRPK